jgi:hypothetical protein
LLVDAQPRCVLNQFFTQGIPESVSLALNRYGETNLNTQEPMEKSTHNLDYFNESDTLRAVAAGSTMIIARSRKGGFTQRLYVRNTPLFGPDYWRTVAGPFEIANGQVLAIRWYGIKVIREICSVVYNNTGSGTHQLLQES